MKFMVDSSHGNMTCMALYLSALLEWKGRQYLRQIRLCIGKSGWIADSSTASGIGVAGYAISVNNSAVPVPLSVSDS